MTFEWNADKAAANFKKHGVRFPEAEPVFADDYAITTMDVDSSPHEQRFLSIGMGDMGRILVIVFRYRHTDVRIISARLANRNERMQYEENR
jgi:uncharacterized DUF497 family protein